MNESPWDKVFFHRITAAPEDRRNKKLFFSGGREGQRFPVRSPGLQSFPRSIHESSNKRPLLWERKKMGWEYHTEVFDFTREAFISQGGLFNSAKFNHELNRLGWDSWELVSVFDTNRVQGGTKHVVAVLKRPLTEERRAELQGLPQNR